MTDRPHLRSDEHKQIIPDLSAESRNKGMHYYSVSLSPFLQRRGGCQSLGAQADTLACNAVTINMLHALGSRAKSAHVPSVGATGTRGEAEWRGIIIRNAIYRSCQLAVNLPSTKYQKVYATLLIV